MITMNYYIVYTTCVHFFSTNLAQLVAHDSNTDRVRGVSPTVRDVCVVTE